MLRGECHSRYLASLKGIQESLTMCGIKAQTSNIFPRLNLCLGDGPRYLEDALKAIAGSVPAPRWVGGWM